MKYTTWIISFLVLFVAVKYNDYLMHWNKQFWDKHFGIVEVEKLGLSYRKRGRHPALILDIGGVHLRVSPSINNTTAEREEHRHPLAVYALKLYHQVPKPALDYVLDKSTRLALRTILSDAVLQITNLNVERDGVLEHLCCVYTDFKPTPASLPVIYSWGPIHFYAEKNACIALADTVLV